MKDKWLDTLKKEAEDGDATSELLVQYITNEKFRKVFHDYVWEKTKDAK
jgi:hypothetical protein